jgi:uncharacterized protein YukE
MSMMKINKALIDETLDSLQQTTFPEMADTDHGLQTLQGQLAHDFQGHAGSAYQGAAVPFQKNLQAYIESVTQLKVAVAAVAAEFMEVDGANAQRFHAI